jgi:hypothetical protein
MAPPNASPLVAPPEPAPLERILGAGDSEKLERLGLPSISVLGIAGNWRTAMGGRYSHLGVMVLLLPSSSRRGNVRMRGCSGYRRRIG